VARPRVEPPWGWRCGARAVERALVGLDPWPFVGLVAALSLFSAALAPFAAAAALRINVR